MSNAYLNVAASWFFPGAGYLMQGLWTRGLLVGGVIWAMFIIAMLSGGAYYPGFSFADGALLYLLDIFARFGNILGLIISFILGMNPPRDAASWATFEYAGRFMEVAGLLNFLSVLDVYDISVGRKK